MKTQALARLASLHSIQPGYVDMSRRWRPASTATLLGVLRALGVPIAHESAAREFLHMEQARLARQRTEPVHVAWRDRNAEVSIQLPAELADASARYEIVLENGGQRTNSIALSHLPVRGLVRLDGRRIITKALPLPPRLPAGYHRLNIECGGEQFSTLVISAPPRCFAPARARREWGLFAPTYALHSARSWGAGDLRDLREFVTWTADAGGGFVGTLPLLPGFLEQPCEPSPYSPLSRLFWNEFHLDVESAPGFARSPGAARAMNEPAFARRLKKLRESPLVNYRAQTALKRRVLEAMVEEFFSRPDRRRPAFDRFVREHPRVADYARFRAVQESTGLSWRQWPQRLRDGDLRDGDTREAAVHYHLYTQWLAHEQMSALSAHARKRRVGLFLDLPLGTHPDGYDAWRSQNLFAFDASGGAPRDPVFTNGQNWGFAPTHPRRCREHGHGYFIACLRHHLRHASMLRLDHVMSLHRLYWVPRDLPASDGAYVTYPAEELHAILCLESQRHRAAIVGENLGTVPPEVNDSMQRHGLNETFVVQYEAQPKSRRPMRPVPAASVASVNTHDMPTFAAWRQGLDLQDRRELGLLPHRAFAREEAQRRRTVSGLTSLLRREGWLKSGPASAEELLSALIAHLGDGDARYVMLNLEDCWLETGPQNVPGTTSERPNWRRKTRHPFEQWKRMASVADLLRRLKRARARRHKACPQ